MIYTAQGLELARITVTNWDEIVLLDLLIKPDSPIIDYNTRYSGISSRLYDPDSVFTMIDSTNAISSSTTTPYVTFTQAREIFLNLLSSDASSIVVIVGHSLENDLRAIKIIHPYIIDTSQLFPHPKGSHLRSGLRYLAATHLHEFIQQSGNGMNNITQSDTPATAAAGHSSLEDARASLRLFKFKMHQYNMLAIATATSDAV